MSRLSSIPPITSTGKNRRKTAASFDGLAHISIGRYMSEKNRNIENESWDITKYSKSVFNQKSKNKNHNVHKIKCVVDILDEYNDDDDFAIILTFSGFDFLSSKFDKSYKNDCSFYTKVSYQEATAYLVLTTIGDIFEYEVISDMKSDKRFFNDEIYIPNLLCNHDPLSMNVEMKNSCLIVSYKRKSKN